MPEMRIVRTRKRGFPHEGWIWEEVVEDFESALERRGAVASGSGRPSALLDMLGRIVSRMPMSIPRNHRSSKVTVLGLMGTKPRLAFPHAFRPHRLIMYVWDCWPVDDQRWAEIFRKLNPSVVYFTSSHAAERWNGKIHAETAWLPEAIDPRRYEGGAQLESRSIDVLEFGRRYDAFHAEAISVLGSAGFVHLHPTPERPHLFANGAALADGLRDAKVTVCYPASISHPEGRAGGVETMTYRYLEAVAAGSLVVGKIPAEMSAMFGFIPGIDLPVNEVASELPDILANIGRHQNAVDRARSRLLEIGTWDETARRILGIASE